MKKLFLIAVTLTFTLVFVAQGREERPAEVIVLKPYKGKAIVSYNCENLFDTIDQPDVIDEDFLPSGKLKWNSTRYQTKLDHIVEAVTLQTTSNPLIIGLVEVENYGVLKDLKSHGKLSETRYEVAHKDSPDKRGIDCGLLYDKDRFKPLVITNLAVKIDTAKNFFTRDVLYVKGELFGGKIIHVFVNHWPSRRSGEKESEHLRVRAAEVARAKINEILKENPKANILLMGDFNDHPDNISLETTLGAGQTKDKTKDLVNLMYDDHLAGEGTHSYQGKWGVLDQIIVSKSFYKGKGKIKILGKDAKIIKDDKLLFEMKDGSKKPSTTYGGEKYYGGYSDHLPIQITLK